jgi:hypothetical protein
MGAMVLGAKFLGAKVLERKCELIAELVKLEGYLPRSLTDYREYLYEALMEYAQQVLSEEDYQAFYGSF